MNNYYNITIKNKAQKTNITIVQPDWYIESYATGLTDKSAKIFNMCIAALNKIKANSYSISADTLAIILNISVNSVKPVVYKHIKYLQNFSISADLENYKKVFDNVEYKKDVLYLDFNTDFADKFKNTIERDKNENIKVITNLNIINDLHFYEQRLYFLLRKYTKNVHNIKYTNYDTVETIDTRKAIDILNDGNEYRYTHETQAEFLAKLGLENNFKSVSEIENKILKKSCETISKNTDLHFKYYTEYKYNNHGKKTELKNIKFVLAHTRTYLVGETSKAIYSKEEKTAEIVDEWNNI